MDFNSIFSKVQEVQENLKKAQEDLVLISETAESGGGMVKVTVNGKRQLTDISIDEDIISKDDKEMIQDLIIAATNKALEGIEVKIKEALAKSTSGVMPNIPGFDISKFM